MACLLWNPVALDFLKVLSSFSNLVFSYFLILMSKDSDQSCTELLARLSLALWYTRKFKGLHGGLEGGADEHSLPETGYGDPASGPL